MASANKRPCRVFTDEEAAEICARNASDCESSIDSSTGGISSTEEEELVEELCETRDHHLDAR